ncbi:MAG TPA: glycine cleavage system protein GcvH [Clostridiales bacterium]|nr:glycine cleavage system protein GcvH [Clostridiales bacterium]
MTPTDRKYTKEHEWLLIEGNTVKIGITDHAQEALGEIVFVELPGVGDEFEIGDSFATVESVKAASSIYTAAKGKVIEINEKLDAEPEAINQDAYANYLVVMEFSEIDESQLMSAAEYDEFVKSEE